LHFGKSITGYWWSFAKSTVLKNAQYSDKFCIIWILFTFFSDIF